VYGGSSFAASLIDRNLIDEYHLLLNPVLFGSGLAISAGLADTLRLTLVTNGAFSCGTALLCYEPFRDSIVSHGHLRSVMHKQAR
jgi:dihydrofolate reductase